MVLSLHLSTSCMYSFSSRSIILNLIILDSYPHQLPNLNLTWINDYWYCRNEGLYSPATSGTFLCENHSYYYCMLEILLGRLSESLYDQVLVLGFRYVSLMVYYSYQAWLKYWFKLFLEKLTGFEENFQVCENQYSSWFKWRSWTALLCVRPFEPRRGGQQTYWATVVVCFVILRWYTSYGVWRRNLHCVNVNQGTPVVVFY